MYLGFPNWKPEKKQKYFFHVRIQETYSNLANRTPFERESNSNLDDRTLLVSNRRTR